jgi:hypothetical protein
MNITGHGTESIFKLYWKTTYDNAYQMLEYLGSYQLKSKFVDGKQN